MLFVRHKIIIKHKIKDKCLTRGNKNGMGYVD